MFDHAAIEAGFALGAKSASYYGVKITPRDGQFYVGDKPFPTVEAACTFIRIGNPEEV